MTSLSLRRPDTGRPSVRRLAAVGGLALLGLAAGFALYAQATKVLLAANHPPPGRLVDVGGYRLHLDCRGEGPVRVLLEAGNADFSVHWSEVQPALARITRVCAYDRAGLGWSEPGPHPRTTDTANDELEALLSAGNIPPPYLLVGHSFGGVLARHFAARHAGEVIGLVLVDAAHPAQLTRLPALETAIGATAAQFEALAPLTTFGLLALMPGNIPDPGLGPTALENYRATVATGSYFAAAADETAMLADNLRGDDLVPLGDLPLAVISRGESAAGNGAEEIAWRALQHSLLSLSTQSRQVIAAQSGHYVHLDEPELVTEVVKAMLGARR